MVRKRDPIWDYAEELPGKRWRCIHCQAEFSGGAARIKAHVLRIPGQGIRFCDGLNVGNPPVSSVSARPHPEHEELTGWSAGNTLQDSHQLPGSSRQCLHSSIPQTPSVSGMPMTPLAAYDDLFVRTDMPEDFDHEPEHLPPQLPVLVDIGSIAAVCPTQEGETDVTLNVQSLGRPRNDVGEHSGYATCPRPSNMAKGNPFASRKLVGESPQQNIDDIWGYLMKNDVHMIGVYGMGGVGKTETLKHVHNRALIDNSYFDHVLWVTVSKNFSIHKLQSDIARAIDSPDLFKNTDRARRATLLMECLAGKGKLLLILDDVWEHFELEEVGIPAGSNGLKLVVTTRKLDVCQRMLLQGTIKIRPLSPEEAWGLFIEKLGSSKLLSSEKEETARHIVRECAGLPLGIITMAASMRAMDKLYDWQATLEKLKEPTSAQQDIEEKVFPVLEVSYSRLTKQAQQCLLRCALYPEDWWIPRLDLIELLIDEGLIDDMNRRQKMYNEGNRLLDELIKSCLLESEYDGSVKRWVVKMHDLIRDMALDILENSMVKAGMQLEEMPDDRLWTKELRIVSLMKNQIRKVPLGRSPVCPELSILLLNDNRELFTVPESFFRTLCGLKVLNLSRTSIKELPISISDLVNLEALLLSKCFKLCHIPSLAKLISLKKLDLSWCWKLKALPDGLERLVDLTYLNLFRVGISHLSDGLLLNLEKLQYLKLSLHEARGAEVARLKYLEILACNFLSSHEWNTYLQSTECMPFKFKIIVGDKKDDDNDEIYHDIDDDKEEEEKDDISYKKVTLIDSRKVEEINNCYHIHEDIQILVIRYYMSVGNELSFYPCEITETPRLFTCPPPLWVLRGVEDEQRPLPSPASLHFPHIKVLQVYKCQKLKYLLSPTASVYLRNLKHIVVWSCDELESIMAAESKSKLPAGVFANLEEISVTLCDKMKTVVAHHLLPHLRRLRTIKVKWCKRMEFIVSPPPAMCPCLSTSLNSFTSLVVEGCDSMRRLLTSDSLSHLPELERVYVADCEGIEAIVGRPYGGSSSLRGSARMQKLKCVELHNLANLEIIYEDDGACFSDSIEKICALNCPKLKKIPIILPRIGGGLSALPFLRKIIVDHQQWESLQWEQPEAKALLQPFVTLKNPNC